MITFSILIVLFVSFVLGIFAFSNIIFPIIYGLPLVRRLQSEDALSKPIPTLRVITPCVLWSVILYGIWYATQQYHPGYERALLLGLGASLVLVFIWGPQQRQSLAEDFYEAWGSYLKTTPQAQESMLQTTTNQSAEVNDYTKIIHAYGFVLEKASEDPKYMSAQYPESLLPYPRNTIKKALEYAIEQEKDEYMLNQLKISLELLNDFIDDNDVPTM